MRRNYVSEPNVNKRRLMQDLESGQVFRFTNGGDGNYYIRLRDGSSVSLVPGDHYQTSTSSEVTPVYNVTIESRQ